MENKVTVVGKEVGNRHEVSKDMGKNRKVWDSRCIGKADGVWGAVGRGGNICQRTWMNGRTSQDEK